MVLTEDQLRRIRDPERSTSVGRIGETPEETEERQAEAVRRGAQPGWTHGTTAKDTFEPTRPEADSPAQIAAEREFVEQTLKKETPDLVKQLGQHKNQFIDQVREKITQAGDKFASFNVTARARDVADQLNEEAKTRASGIAIPMIPDDSAQVSQLLKEQRGGPYGISTPQGDYFYDVGLSNLKTGDIGINMIPRMETATPERAATLGAGLDSFIGGVSKGVAGIAISPLYFSTEIGKAFVKGKTPDYVGVEPKGDIFFSKNFLAAGITGGALIAQGFGGSLKTTIAGGKNVFGIATGQKLTGSQFYKIGESTALAGMLAMPKIAGMTAGRIANRARLDTEIFGVKLGATEEGAAGRATALTVIGTGKAAKLFQTESILGFRGNKAGSTFLSDSLTREMNRRGEFVGLPVSSAAMGSAKDIISIKPANAKNSLMGISLGSTKSFTAGEFISRIPTAGGKTKDVFGQFAANTESAKIGSELFSTTRGVGIGGSIMKATGRDFFGITGISRTGRRSARIKGGAEAYDIEMPSKDTTIFRSSKSRGMTNFSWLRSPETIKVSEPAAKAGFAIATTKGIGESVARGLYSKAITPRLTAQGGRFGISGFVGGGAANRNAGKQNIFLGQGSALNRIMGNKFGQGIYSGQASRQRGDQFNINLPKLGGGSGSRQGQGELSLSFSGSASMITPAITTTPRLVSIPAITPRIIPTTQPVITGGGLSFSSPGPRIFFGTRKAGGRKSSRRTKKGFGFPRATLLEVNISDIRFGRSTQPRKTKELTRKFKRGFGLSVPTLELMAPSKKRNKRRSF